MAEEEETKVSHFIHMRKAISLRLAVISQGTYISGVSGVNSCLRLNTVSVIYINSSPLTSGKISSHLGETNHEDRMHGPTLVPAQILSSLSSLQKEVLL